MNPYKLKNVFEYLTSNNQLLKKKLKLGTSEIPIPPKKDSITTIEAINRFNKANPRVDTTSLKPLSVKHSNNEGVIQGAYDTATREAQQSGYPAPSYDKFKSRYLKKNMKADGGRIGYKDGPKFDVQASGSKSGKQQIANAPEGITSDKELINAILTMDIPLTEKVNLIGDVQYGKFRDKIEYKDNEIFLDDPKSYRDRNIGLDYNRDGEGFSGSATVGDRGPEFKIKFKKSFADGGMLVQPSDDGSRPGYAGTKKTKTTKTINKLNLDKKKIKLNGDDFITGEVRSYIPEGTGKKYVDEYLNFVDKNYLKNDMSKVDPFQAYIKNRYPKKYSKIISDVNQSGYRGLKNISTTYKKALANELITAANSQIKFVDQFDILKKLVSPTRAAQYENKGGLYTKPPEFFDEDTLNNFKNLDKMENKLSKALTYIVDNNVKIIDPKKLKIPGSGGIKPGSSPIRKMIHYLAGGGSETNLNKALEINPWYKSQNFKVGDTTKNTFNYLSSNYGNDFIGQPFNTAYDFALQRRGRIKLKGMSGQPLPENLIWEFAARSAQRNFTDGVPIEQWPVKILDKKGNVVDLGKFPVDSSGRKLLNTSELQFEFNEEIFNRKNLKTKGVESGFFNDIYKVSSQFDDYLKQDVPDPDNPKKTIKLRELFDKTEGRIFPTIGHDDSRGGVKKRPFNSFKILTNVENLSLFNAYDKIKNPADRKKVVSFIYGDTKGRRGDKYKQAWIDKNVPFITEYIKTGQGLEQTPYKQGLGKYKIPTSKTAMELSSFPANIPAMYKKLGSVGRKAVGIGTGFLSEKIFFDLDKNNMISKGMSEEEAAAQAMENLTFGLYENKAYMNSLKETAESMGIDSTTFDSAYQLNILNKEFEKNSKNVEEQMAIALENQDVKTSEDLRKNFNIYADRARTEYERLENDISGRISGGSPQIMSNAKNFLTDEQFAKPFYDMQDAAIEKLKREKLNAFDTQKLQSDTAAGDTGNTLLSNVFNMQSLPRAGKFLFDLANPLSPLPKYKDYLSDAEKENQMLRSLEPSDLNLVNLARGFTRDNIRSANVESPILANDIENIKYQNPGVFFSKGGIASLTKTIPPESGPTPHGLRYPYNNVKKI